MLGRLRTELARISPAPCSIAAACDEIAMALIRAELGAWTLPRPDDPTVLRHADESICIPLASHVIVINRWGAFRILDCLLSGAVYFEMAGLDGRAFTLPWIEGDDSSIVNFSLRSGCNAR